jgi:hypothetical protein
VRDSQFWKIIEGSRTRGRQEQPSSLRLILSETPPREILSFARIQHRKMHELHTQDLWIAHYIIRGSASLVEFEDFSSWIVMQGRLAFDRIRRSPSHLADVLGREDVPRIDWGLYTALAEKAYLDKTRKGDFWTRLGATAPPEIALEWPKNPEGFRSRHPRLFTLFWDPLNEAKLPVQTRNLGIRRNLWGRRGAREWPRSR